MSGELWETKTPLLRLTCELTRPNLQYRASDCKAPGAGVSPPRPRSTHAACAAPGARPRRPPRIPGADRPGQTPAAARPLPNRLLPHPANASAPGQGRKALALPPVTPLPGSLETTHLQKDKPSRPTEVTAVPLNSERHSIASKQNERTEEEIIKKKRTR